MIFKGQARVFTDGPGPSVSLLYDDGSTFCNCRANTRRGKCAHRMALELLHQMGAGGPETAQEPRKASRPSRRRAKAPAVGGFASEAPVAFGPIPEATSAE